MGRPPKYSPERTKRICDAIRAGNSKDVAARLAGIDRGTLFAWQNRYHDFADAVKEAEAQAEARMVGIIATAAPRTWTAAAWWLERRRPEEWALRQRLLVGGDKEAGPVQVQATVLPPGLTVDELRRLAEMEDDDGDD